MNKLNKQTLDQHIREELLETKDKTKEECLKHLRTPTGCCFDFALGWLMANRDTLVLPLLEMPVGELMEEWRLDRRSKHFDGLLPPNTLLVHGRPKFTYPEEGEWVRGRIDHAWLEYENRLGEVFVIDGTVSPVEVVRREVFYAVTDLNPPDVKRYTVEEAMEKMLEHEHWGSWE